MTGTCVAQIADPDKPGRLYGCDRGQHAGGHHTLNDRGEDVTWGDTRRGTQAPRPSEALVEAYAEHHRAARAQRLEPNAEHAERLRVALEFVTVEEQRYAAECIAAGFPPVAKPLPLDGLGS